MNANWQRFSMILLALGALAAAFVVLQVNSGSRQQHRTPAAGHATGRLYETAANDTETCPEPPPVEVLEEGPGERVFGSYQAFESDSELWIFLDVDVIIPRPVGSPSYGQYQLALHAFVLDKNGVKARYETPPTLARELGMRSGFRRIAGEDFMSFYLERQVVSERLGLRVQLGGADAPNQAVAESIDGIWREVVLEIDPHWSSPDR